MMKRCSKVVFFIFFYVIGLVLNAQIQFTGQPNICLSDPASFSYTPPAGKNPTSWKWDFGDGSSSTQKAPVYLYKKAGSFDVKLEAQYPGGTLNETITVFVRNLPKAIFSASGNWDSCSNQNLICFTDASKEAEPGQALVSRLAIWGDGNFDKSINPSANKLLCHKYAQANDYTITFEVTDQFGCKDEVSKKFKVIQGINASFVASTTYPDCKSTKICIRNTSSGVGGVNYKWKFGTTPSTGNYFANPGYCRTFQTNSSYEVELIANASNGCRDTFTRKYNITDNKGGDILGDDTLICYSGEAVFKHKDKNFDWVIWYVDNDIITTRDSIVVKPKKMKLNPGVHILKKVSLRGNCRQEVLKKIRVLGPKAEIIMSNAVQCRSDKEVYFIGDPSYTYSKNTVYYWQIQDGQGDTCTAKRREGVNKNKNCNRSTDWYHKHFFKEYKNSYKVSFWLKDTVTGCEDKADTVVHVDACKGMDGNIVQGKRDLEICQNTWLREPGDDPKGDDPIRVTFDSGKTWLNYPIFVDTSYLETYDLGFIYQYILPVIVTDLGDDSIHIDTKGGIRFDTFLNATNLHVNPIIIDDISLQTEAFCDSLKFWLSFQKGKFDSGDTVLVDYSIALGSKLKSDTFTDNKSFSLDTIRKTIYGTGATGFVDVTFVSVEGCKNNISKPLRFGFSSHIEKEGKYCVGDQVDFEALATDLVNEIKWNKHNQLGQVKWVVNDTLVYDSIFKWQYELKEVGEHNIEAIFTSSKGCIKRHREKVIVQQVVAGVTQDSKVTTCNFFRQFFDSSMLLYTGGNDKIIAYHWNWGSNLILPSVVKDPFVSLAQLQDSTITINHSVISSSGCRDTVTYNLKIEGSKAKFSLQDSIGCAPFKAVFNNLSSPASQYFWEFGNQNNAVRSMRIKDSVHFTYMQPGKYFAKLTVLDSSYNPSTGTTYHCKHTFPEDDSIFIYVLPNHQSTISSKDTVCLGSRVEFVANSSPKWSSNNWISGNRREVGDTLHEIYNSTGRYEIQLFPVITSTAPLTQRFCLDTATKQVVVVDNYADFEIDLNSTPPVYDFINQSGNLNNHFVWNFGDPSSGKWNTSFDVHPSHNYGSDSNLNSVCLVAINKYGCRDTVCKELRNTYRQYLYMYNTFTPSNDGFNDEYDVLIVGEKTYNLRIYNRQGTLVYEGDRDSENGNGVNWNGRLFNTGPECAQGTYFYSFEYTFYLEPERKLKANGTITLIR